MRRKITKEIRKAAIEAKREKDTIYYVRFIPIDSELAHDSFYSRDPWCVEIPCNPEGKEHLMLDAIRIFERRHNVDSWRDIASKTKVESLYYP